MNDFSRVTQLLKESKAELNELYKRLDGNEILNEVMPIAEFEGSKSEKIALLRRIPCSMRARATRCLRRSASR